MAAHANQNGGITRYTGLAIILHWLIATAILTLIVMGLVMDHLYLDPMRVFELYQLHKSIGITVMLLIVLRLAWRLTHKAPPLPDDIQGFERVGAHLAHAGLYGLQIFMPLTGWAMVSVSVLGIPTILYWTVPWPDLPVLSTLANKAPVETLLKNVHHWGGWLFLALIALHIAAALRHHFILKDHILRQMLPVFGKKSATRRGD